MRDWEISGFGDSGRFRSMRRLGDWEDSEIGKGLGDSRLGDWEDGKLGDWEIGGPISDSFLHSLFLHSPFSFFFLLLHSFSSDSLFSSSLHY